MSSGAWSFVTCIALIAIFVVVIYIVGKHQEKQSIEDKARQDAEAAHIAKVTQWQKNHGLQSLYSSNPYSKQKDSLRYKALKKLFESDRKVEPDVMLLIKEHDDVTFWKKAVFESQRRSSQAFYDWLKLEAYRLRYVAFD